MARTQNPLIGVTVNSVGGTTFSKVGKNNILRSKPFQVKNPKTLLQRNNRGRFLILQMLSLAIANSKAWTDGERKKFKGGVGVKTALVKKGKDSVIVSDGEISWKGGRLTFGGNKMYAYAPTALNTSGASDIDVTWNAGQVVGTMPVTAKIAVHIMNLTKNEHIRNSNAGAGFAIAAEEATTACPGNWDIANDVITIALETYESAPTAGFLTGYAPGWGGFPDIVSVDDMQLN